MISHRIRERKLTIQNLYYTYVYNFFYKQFLNPDKSNCTEKVKVQIRYFIFLSTYIHIVSKCTHNA